MNLTRRIICIALAFCLVFTLGSPAFAAGTKAASASKYKTYTILGDSNASGYGLPEYEKLAQSKGSILADGEAISTAYGAMVSDAIGATTTYWRAHSGWRTTDFLRAVGYTGFSFTKEPDSAYKVYIDERSWVKDGQFFLTAFGQTSFNRIELKNSIKNTVAASDIVTVQLGSNDIFTYMLMALIEKWGDIFGEVNKASTPSEAIRAFNDGVKNLPAGEKKLLLSDVVNACEEGLRMFKENYPKVIDYIESTANNPDIKIVVLGLLNPIDDLFNFSEGIDLNLFTASDLTCIKANNFLKNLCANDKNCTFVNIKGCDGYGLPAMDWDKVKNGTGLEPTFAAIKIVHPSELGHKQIAELIIEALDVGKGVTKLAAPKVTATLTSDLAVKLSWAKISGATKYEVYRATSKTGSYSKLATTNKTSYTNTSAKAGKTYYYKVKAISSNATSDFSAVVSKTVKLAAPVVKLSTVAASGKIKVSWDKVTNATKYEVYRATSKSGKYTKITTTTNKSYTDNNAKAGKAYYYKVRAICNVSAASSAYSTVHYITCDLARPSVKITTSKGDPKLTWAKIDGATKYEVYRATSRTGTYSKMITTTKTSYTNTSAKAGKTYYYKVKAVCSVSAAASAYSTVVSIKAK